MRCDGVCQWRRDKSIFKENKARWEAKRYQNDSDAKVWPNDRDMKRLMWLKKVAKKRASQSADKENRTTRARQRLDIDNMAGIQNEHDGIGPIETLGDRRERLLKHVQFRMRTRCAQTINWGLARGKED